MIAILALKLSEFLQVGDKIFDVQLRGIELVYYLVSLVCHLEKHLYSIFYPS